MNTQSNKNKIKTTGDISTKNNKNSKDNHLFNFVSPKNNKKIIKRETRLFIQRKCYISKTTIENY